MTSDFADAAAVGRGCLLGNTVTTMMMPRLKTVVPFTLLIGMIGATAALTYSGAWADEKLANKAPPPATGARNGDKLNALHKQRQALAQGQFKSWREQALQALKVFAPLSDARPSPFSSGSTPGFTPQQLEASQGLERRINQVRVADAQVHLYQWAHRLLAAELEMNDKADRAAVYAAHLKRMKNLEDEFKKVVEPPSKEFVQRHGEGIKVFTAEAEFHRLEAEILLEREREKP